MIVRFGHGAQKIMVYIKRNKDKRFNAKWIVVNSKLKSRDLVETFGDAIRFFLWHLGVPARIIFKKSTLQHNDKP